MATGDKFRDINPQDFFVTNAAGAIVGVQAGTDISTAARFLNEAQVASLLAGGGGGGLGTVSNFSAVQPVAGITTAVLNPTTTPQLTLALADDLLAVEGLSGTGIVRRTAANAWSAGTAVDLASEVSGTLPVANGGTGTTSSTGTGVVVLATAPSVTSLTTNKLLLAGNISAPAWTTSGLRIAGVAATLTDTTSTGTVAAAYTDALGGNTIAAISVTTFTNYVTAYFKEPIAGTNVTFTSKFALGADSLFVGAAGVSLAGSTSGAVKVVAPAVAGTAVITMPGVTGTLTTAATTLTANALLLGNGGTDEKVSTGITSNGASEIALGVSATTAGAVNLYGSTSGLTRLKAPAVAVTGDVVLPGVAGTLATLGANTLTGAQTIPAGSASATSINFGTPGTGIYSASAATMVSIAAGASEGFRVEAGLVYIFFNLNILSNSNELSFGSSSDVRLGYGGAATLRLGGANSASPVAQALRSQGSRASVDSNVGGGHLSIGSGIGTGTGTPSELRLQAPVVVVSGTGAQTQTTGLKITQGVAVRTVLIVANLPTPSATLEGGMAWVTDATMSLALGLGTIVVGGSTNKTPVSCNGTNWLIG